MDPGKRKKKPWKEQYIFYYILQQNYLFRNKQKMNIVNHICIINLKSVENKSVKKKIIENKCFQRNIKKNKIRSQPKEMIQLFERNY